MHIDIHKSLGMHNLQIVCPKILQVLRPCIALTELQNNLENYLK